jgi:secretion/DNA translocation related TadE-like protein
VRSERASVSIVAAGAMVIALVLAMGTADVAKVLIAQTRAQTAADAAALAAAQELALPEGRTPTDVAAEYASRDGASLSSCTCEVGSFEAVVEVALAVGPLLLFDDDRAVTAKARAVVDPP